MLNQSYSFMTTEVIAKLSYSRKENSGNLNEDCHSSVLDATLSAQTVGNESSTCFI